MKRETRQGLSPTPRRGARLAVGVAVTLVLVTAGGWWLWQQVRPQEGALPASPTPRFSPGHRATQEDLATLHWEEIGQLTRVIGADPAELIRVADLAEVAGTPPARYLRAMLLVVLNKPAQALTTFDSLDPQEIPADLLYAPYRLAGELSPSSPNRYLPALRQAIVEDKVVPLVKARVQAQDGELAAALENYLRTDPASWTRFDLRSLQRIANHQGLAADLAALIAGALSSGRVNPRLAPGLQGIVGRQPGEAEVEMFKQRLRRALEEQTPEGELAVESARNLLQGRQMFLARNYNGLIDAHREAEAVSVPTETVLLLFLSAVEVKERMEIDRWGQELKRRHGEEEVRKWVDEMAAAAQ